MDPHGYGRPHSKTDYSWAGSDSQVNHNTFTDTSSIDDNQEAQFEAQFSRDHGIGGWIDPRESQPVIHPNVSSVATSHVDPEHSLPYLSSRSFKHVSYSEHEYKDEVVDASLDFRFFFRQMNLKNPHPQI